MRYITRVDYVARVPKHANARGKRAQKRRYWQVRIGRGHREESPIRKQFFDGAHGGKEKALRAAKKWRNEQLRRR